VDKARYPVEAHLLEGRSASELAAAHGVHRSWIYKLLARYRAGGYGREIAFHPAERFERAPSISTVWRVLKREGLVVSQPQKRPRPSLIRFEAELPNEMWQADVTHWALAGEGHAEMLNVLDDHSRLFLASRAFPTVKAADVLDVFRMAIALHGAPASLLCDNGAVFMATPRSSCRQSSSAWGSPPRTPGPTTPQTCGKREGRAAAPDAQALPVQAGPAPTLAGLQEQLDGFTGYYNATRPPPGAGGRTPLRPTPPRSRPGRLLGPQSRPTSEPPGQGRRHGTVTLRHDSRLHHIGIGRAHKGWAVKLLVADRDIRALDLHTGELIRRLTLDPNRDYQPIEGG
jgi:transposase